MQKFLFIGLCAVSLSTILAAAEIKTVYDFNWQKPLKKVKLTGDVKIVNGREGKKALQFNGKKAYAEAPHYGNPTAFSGEAWINVQGPSKGNRGIILIRRSKGNQWQFWVQPDAVYFFTWNRKAKYSLPIRAIAKVQLKKDKWYHVAFETDSDKLCRIYINGEKKFDGKPTHPVERGSSPVRVGGDSIHTFNGLIGEAKVYNGLLPKGRIAVIRELQAPPYKRTISVHDAMGFEKVGAWNTAPVAMFDMVPEYKLWHNRTRKFKGCQVSKISSEKLASGAKLSNKHVTQGNSSLHWNDHTTYPTIACWKVPKNWAGKKALSLDIYSTKATGEIVTIAILSDSPKTKWKDYYYFPIKINWQGAKTVSIPLAEFKKYEQPAGWDKVGGIYLFTKIFGSQPNPYTDLYLDNLKLDSKAPNADWKKIAAQFPDRTGKDGFTVKHSNMEWQNDQLNHNYPETVGSKDVYTPYAYQNYFRNERDIFKWYPKFKPGYVCFDPKGKTYINSGDTIQWKGPDGKWQVSNTGKAVEDWARKQGWKGVKNAWSHSQSEKAIRFDKDGDAYVLIQAEALNAEGKPFDWKTRCTLLLHSNDKMKSWKVYKLPSRVGEFEKMDGNNLECLDRPPVIVLGDYKYFGNADPKGYILLPEKHADGTLTLPKRIKFADYCISVAQHSGGGNHVITKNGKIYIAYSWYVPKLHQKGDWKATCPSIPEDHPGMKMFYDHKAHSVKRHFSKDGIPAFVVEYDLKTKKMSQPVYVGSGGGFHDSHNWPAITVDNKGYLHVIVNGHHNPTTYIRSIKPLDASAWTAPKYIMLGKQRHQPCLSYATMNCDKKGNIYTAHRSTTGMYNNHIGLYRMKPDGQWQEEETLVTPFKYMYKVWGNKMMYDPGKDRMCLTFYGQSSMKQLSRDQFEFDVFYWPDHEKTYYANTYNKGINRGPAKPTGGCTMVMSAASEPASLISTGPGKKWKLVTSKDLR
jgi:Concanavalin A-like lectin/glucanases superfamily/BNR repeat-containing family member